jgi:hypothetical protein
MTAMTYETAKNIGIAVVVGLVVLMVISAIVIKNITTKLITALILAALAFGVWTQRSSLQDCAGKVRDRGTAVGNDVTCSFLGSDINISVP